ncbi:MAG TPA: bifunctional riboflavin kinase/FAD synthetase [Ideonella sp.]|uniref:bifunctional riboflavin kinase/FAD synthetase n=1 Tax=Ideonella sp. TaxID=1929293 RepID=UPI002BC8C8E4|nr:bifunctional riboflavin kinase/FAD synthetase [Ideonella sp.]HSI52289.1 bifunctional riboflavin kinase/FAD synthetase [Ideonella sp.]
MRVFRGHIPPSAQGPQGCALTIGNFDGVHRGHQAMLALLNNEAKHRGLRSCVMTFEPHPRDWFAQQAGKPELAPLRIATLRDKLQELERCGVDDVVLMRFDQRFASQTPQDFIEQVLVKQLNARYVLVGDDFRFGARRAGDYAMLDNAGNTLGFDVARMLSYEVHGMRVSSSAVREALSDGAMERAAALLGRPYSISGHVVHGRKLGRDLGFRTLNLRFPSHRPAAQGIFVVRVHGLGAQPLPGVASLGVRPTIEDAGRVLLEVHCLDWPADVAIEGGYARILQVDLTHKLHDERKYESLDALRAGIEQDVVDAKTWWKI